jgi:hypothetical protein
MRVDIRDVKAVGALRPLEVAGYLRAKGWTQKYATLGREAIWTSVAGGEEYEILLPLDQTTPDFSLRMGDLLHILAEVERRSQTWVYDDLLTTMADVLRIRIDDPDLIDGSMPMEGHAQIAQKTRDLVLAAACAVSEPRPVWHTRKPARATEHLRHVRIGQTQRGSYVITVISRIPPLLHTTPGQMELVETEPPYERQVMNTLARALLTLDRAAEQAALTAALVSFEQAVQRGVSANLCDAVTGLWGDGDGPRTLEFLFSWSAARPPEADIPTSVTFAADRIPVIREASRLLREKAPITDYELEGAVVKLERPEGAPTGHVTVMGQVEGLPRRVVVELADPQYHDAVLAHDQEKALRCVGTLIREGRGYVLQSPRDVAVADT